MREVTLFKGFMFNPVVSVAAALLLWGFVIYVSADSDNAVLILKEGQAWVSTTFTWFYIASQDYWLLFLLPLTYYYGHVKLGKDDEEPEFSDISYFSMVFCAGVAIGLIFYGASEPLWHMLESSDKNRYNNDGYSNDNQKAQMGINVTLFHWGLQAWVVYGIAAISMGILSYRHGLPLCFRSTLAPLFGKATWGWFGDIVDVLTIVTIVSGLCTSLGLGAQQMVGGMQRLGWLDGDLSENGVTNAASVAVAVITCIATMSVVSGLNWGIQSLSQTAFVLGNFLLLVVFFGDSPWYLLNVLVQSVGYHFQHFIEISFDTDAFAQLRTGEGAPNDGRGASSTWMNGWTLFYWGWWISWAPFVGTFLARISKGRTIRNVLMYSLAVPFFYAALWFCTFGGAAIRMHRRASFLAKVGEELHNNTDYFVHSSQGWRPVAAGKCYTVPETLPSPYDKEGAYVAESFLSPVCMFSPQDDAGFWFDLMGQFSGLGPFLSVVSVLTIVLYFVTSSDSGSLVVDLIASNGREAHVVQRIFWALSEGAVAVALLQAGGRDALKALQALSIIMGLPFTVIIMFMCTAIWRALKLDQGDMCPRGQRIDWALPLYGGIFDFTEVVFSLGKSTWPSLQSTTDFMLGLFAPPFLLWHSLGGLGGHSRSRKDIDSDTVQKGGGAVVSRASLAATCGFTYVAFIVLQVLSLLLRQPNLSALGWAAFVAFAAVIATARNAIRVYFQIEGSGVEDFFAALLCWPQVLAQMVEQTRRRKRALSEEPCSSVADHGLHEHASDSPAVGV